MVLADITDAIVGNIPRDWPLERVQVFADRVYKAILARHFGANWIKPDVAMKASLEVYADMTAYDPKPSSMPERQLPPPEDGPLLGEEPDFMAKYPGLKAKVDDLPETSPCKPMLAGLLAAGLARHRALYP